MSQSSNNFFASVYLELTGQEATKNTLNFLNELCGILVDFEDNPIEPPSSCVLALTANCGGSFTQCVSAALNCITDKHFLFSSICRFVNHNWKDSQGNVIKKFIKNRKKIPGFGHPSISGEDYRVEEILALTKKFKMKCPRLSFMVILGKQIEPSLNIGGATSAVLLDLGFDEDNVIYFPLIARMFGWLKIYSKLKEGSDPLLPSDSFVEKYKTIFRKE